jgi:HK97 family phage portal protein
MEEKTSSLSLGATHTKNDTYVKNSEIVFGVISRLSSSIASMPIRLYKQYDVVDVTRGRMADLQFLISVRPNNNQTSFEFFRVMEQHRNEYGNAYAYIQRGALNKIEALVPINPSLVSLVLDENNEKWYKYILDGKTYFVHHLDMLHFKHYIQTDGTGVSPIDILSNTLQFERVVMNQTLEQMRKTLGLSGKVTLAGSMNEDLRKEVRGMLAEARYSENSIIVTDPTFDYTNLDQKFFDYRVLDTMSLTTQRIATAFCVPPHLAGDLSRATFSNIESQSLDYINGTLMPIIKQYEQELQYKLLTKSQILSGYTFQFDEMELLRGDSDARANYYEKMLRVGVISRNEVRKQEGYGSTQDGDEFLISLNYVPYNIMKDKALAEVDAIRKGGESVEQPKNIDDNENESTNFDNGTTE